LLSVWRAVPRVYGSAVGGSEKHGNVNSEANNVFVVLEGVVLKPEWYSASIYPLISGRPFNA